jgi:uncharacterized protein
MTPHAFAPYGELAEKLLAMLPKNGDGSHDISHLERVWWNARNIHAKDGGDLELLAASVLLHDCVTIPKNSPLRSQASRLAAEKAQAILTRIGWPAGRIGLVQEAIQSHSYSAGIPPTTLEGCILQDADRLDAIGFLGVARCFYTAGRMQSLLYDRLDPKGDARPLDDARFALDHFPRKLLTLSEGFLTPTGRVLARDRQQALHAFYQGILTEIGVEP